MSEIQDIFNEYGTVFRENNKLPSHKLKAMSAIESCRTASLGAHVDKCCACGHTKISYNSCRNRHCPKCQNIAREQWIEARKSELLNLQYFHVVFTVPDSLNSIFLNNQEIMYKMLFNCVNETLTTLALDKKYLGAQIGLTAVLHTWGQNLMFHPHIHCIVPGGGLSPSGIEFKTSRKKFFIPVKVLSRMFRGKFMFYLNKEMSDKTLKVPENFDFKALKDSLYSIDWVVYCKPPFKSPNHVIEYLGRYTHKVAISNSRIISCKDGSVTFKWRDYKHNNDQKVMTITCEEFIRRFLLHVLPKKFFKIRHYGILGSRNKKTKLARCQRLSGIKVDQLKVLTKRELLQKIFGYDVFSCPHCGSEYVNRRFEKAEFLLE